MSGRFTFLVLLGMAAGLVVFSFIPSMFEPEQRVVEVVRTPAPDPAAFTQAERVRNLDCMPNDEWPEGEYPTAALVRHGDTAPLVRVTFAEAWAKAESGDAWFVASCQGSD